MTRWRIYMFKKLTFQNQRKQQYILSRTRSFWQMAFSCSVLSLLYVPYLPASAQYLEKTDCASMVVVVAFCLSWQKVRK